MARYLWVRDESALRKLVLSPLLLAEAVYRAGAFLHRRAYAWNLWRTADLDPVVISIGNLGVGGAGKTPVVGWLARELHARGHKVAILSRGVRGRRIGAVNVVSDGERVLLAPGDVGDEPVMLAGHCPGVPVLAGRNRRALGLRASAAFSAEVLLLDDGFQHHRLARDLDLVCVDASLGLGNGHVLPRGPLRESPATLARADAVLWTRASDAAEPRDRERMPGGVPQFRLEIVPRGLRQIGAREVEPLQGLDGQEVGVLCAIARPQRFEQDLVQLGAKLQSRRCFPDHHRYRASDLEDLDPALLWVTTGKDAVKIPASWAPPRLVALEEEVRPLDGTALLEFVLARLRNEDGA